MDQRFGGAEKFKLQSLHGHLKIGVPAEACRGFVEFRGSPSIQLCLTVRVGENEIFRDFAKLGVRAKNLHASLFDRRREIEVRSFEKGLRREFCQIIGEFWV